MSVPRPPFYVFCAGHSLLGNGDLLIVGGTDRGHTGENHSARFRLLDGQWSSADMNFRRWYGNGTIMPDGKMLATAGNTYDQMVVFGGRSSGTLVSDVQRYDITTPGAWDPALTGSGASWPVPREGHSLADQAKGPYYLFGGKDASGNTRQDAWKLWPSDNDLAETYLWRQVLPIANPTDIPDRWRHVAMAIPGAADSAMYVFGGERLTGGGTSSTTLGDLWKLSWNSSAGRWEWAQLTQTGDVPSGRSGSAAFWDAANARMILYGGSAANSSPSDANVYALTFSGGTPPSGTWKLATLATGSPTPAARTQHAMAANPMKTFPSTGIVFGGKTASGLSNELWEFTVSTGANPTVTWHLRDPGTGTPAPAPRTDASIVGYEEYPGSHIVFGGSLAGGAADANVWEYRFDAPVGWRQLAASSRAVQGQAAIREQRELTALQPERFDPDLDTWTPLGDLKKRQSYHSMLLGSDGTFYSPGPNYSLRDSTWRFDPATGHWSLYGLNTTDPLDGTISSIMFRPERMMKCGGLTLFEAQGNTNTLPTGSAGPYPISWRPSANKMALWREDHILNMLPTGEVIATGGLGQADNLNADPEDDLPRKRPEIWSPNYAQGGGVGWWYGASTGTLLATEPTARGYHSSAVLLPDGRILSAGGNTDHFLDPVTRSVDQFSPPYLFQPGGDAAFRPRLYGAQDHITWDQDFKVTSPDPIVAACLIRPGATTHGFNQDCRYDSLAVVSQDGHRVTLHSPPTRNHAPPGNYLLFVLRDDNGRKVPSIARWVSVGETQTNYATWDTLPPAPVTDLAVTGVSGTTETLQWTAPADAGDGSSLKATRYELRYRANSAMISLDDFFTYGRRVDPSILPPPATAGTTQSITLTVPGSPPDTVYHFRLVSRDGAGGDRNWSVMSNEAVTPLGGGGCPFVDTHTAAGWQVENSILGRSLTGTMALDSYRLRNSPDVADGRIRLQVRENEQELTTLDQLRLIAIDHEPGVQAFPIGDVVVVGTKIPAARVTTATGVDVTAQVSGAGGAFVGGPGDTLLVEFSSPSTPKAFGKNSTTGGGGGFVDGDGGKCPPDCGSPAPLMSPIGPFAATNVDALVLAESGVLIQTPDGAGGWQTIATRYPREYYDEAAYDLDGPLRLVFVGRHTIRFLGRLDRTANSFTAHKLPLLLAQHSRLGNVTAAIDTIGNLTTELAPQDTVHLEFGWTPVPTGQARELLLLSRGVYTSNLPAAHGDAPPQAFAIHPVQPNPFVGSALLRFSLPMAARVKLEVLDAQGRRVRVLTNAFLDAGEHTATWDGRTDAGERAGPGIYFYRFDSGIYHRRGRVTRLP